VNANTFGNGLFVNGWSGIQTGAASSSGNGIFTSCTSSGSSFCTGIYAQTNVGSGSNGTAGYFSSTGGRGVWALGTTGVYATSTLSSGGRGVDAVTDFIGQVALRGNSLNGTAIEANTDNGIGILARTNGAFAQSTITAQTASYQPAMSAININAGTVSPPIGLYAQTVRGNAVEGLATSSSALNGVQGVTNPSSASGIFGQNNSQAGFGAAGRAFGSGTAVLGDLVNGTTGFAGLFNGRLHVNGLISSTMGKAFMIDHPLDPENKFLVHAAVESNELKNVYDGNATLGPNGEATIRLPSYFDSLNENFRYQLTPIGAPASLYVKQRITGGVFSVAGGQPGQEFSWQVTGTRKDAVAKRAAFNPEPVKATSERGKFVTPEVFGTTARSIFNAAPEAVHTTPVPSLAPPDLSRGPSQHPNPPSLQ
jgi:hypothetical protein